MLNTIESLEGDWEIGKDSYMSLRIFLCTRLLSQIILVGVLCERKSHISYIKFKKGKKKTCFTHYCKRLYICNDNRIKLFMQTARRENARGLGFGSDLKKKSDPDPTFFRTGSKSNRNLQPSTF